MNPNQPETLQSPVLESAWQRYAEFDINARTAAVQRSYLRNLAILLAMVAVLLAVSIASSYNSLPWLVNQVLQLGLVLILIVNFILLTLTVVSHQKESAEILRATAEEIKKEIYLYRTIMQWHDECDQWLSQRINDIQRHVADSFSTELVLKPYTGALPPNYEPDDPRSDPGFTRLLPEQYLRYRLEAQLATYAQQAARPQQARQYLRLGLLVTGGISLLLAALGGAFSAWVAVFIFAAAALITWLEPRQVDAAINDYNQLILGLQIVRDNWHSLDQEEQSGEAFFKTVVATEKVIWSQFNKHSSEMWHAVDELQGRINDAMDEVLLLPASATMLNQNGNSTAKTEEKEDQALAEMINNTAQAPNGQPSKQEEVALTIVEEMEESKPPAKLPKGLPHAFVVMPFGRKQGGDGRWIDFDSVYYQLIKPALEAAGFEPFRADEESVSGDILTDMFQELLLADLVIADLSIDNANVFYELGVRHAFRRRGLIHIQSGRAYMPFDIFNVRTLPYHTDKNGRPDPLNLEKDKHAITKTARETWASDLDRIHSPIFNLLDGLEEPDRRTLRTPLATGFWREYNEWKERVSIAERQKRIGDILLLTEEISNPLIKEEAVGEAGSALRGMGRFELALQQYRRGLEINPRNTEFRRQEAFHLNRLNRTDEAIVRLERLLQDDPHDSEAISFLGRIYKQMWMETWETVTDKEERLREAYNASHWLVKSVDTYLEGYRLDQNNYYPGINALTGSVLLDYLAKEFHMEDDPDIQAVRGNLPKLKGAIHFALESTTQQNRSDYWALASLAELEVSIAEDPRRVTRAYRKALTAARKNVYNLKSSLGQLDLLQSLDFRPEYVQTGIEVLQAEISRIKQEEEGDEEISREEPPQVFLFAGYAVDRPKQSKSRFPASMEKEVRDRIGKALDKLHCDSNDMALTPGAAAGGDIIFLELCLERDLKVEIHLPFQEARYIKEAVGYAGDKWVERFYTIRNHPNVTIRLQPDHLGPVKAGGNIHIRNNRWALYSAMIFGIDHTRLIALWDGMSDDKPAGPDMMVEQVRQFGGIVEHLNTTKFDYWKAEGKVNKALDILAQGL